MTHSATQPETRVREAQRAGPSDRLTGRSILLGAATAVALSLATTPEGDKVFRARGGAAEIAVKEGATARFRLFVFDPAGDGDGCAGLSPDSECFETQGCLFALSPGEVTVSGEGEIPMRYGSDEVPCGVSCNDGCVWGEACRRVCFDEEHPPRERCDGVDNDCDGETDEGFVFAHGGRALGLGADCEVPGVCGAGVVECNSGDPDRLETLCSSGPGGSQDRSGPEQCNGEDDDCDGELPLEEQDLDQDTYLACADPPDCADEVASIHPGAEELCDGEDTDCDGTVPEDELDPDDDGTSECAGDCAPGDPELNPDATELCDGVDNNCDGDTDEGFTYEQPAVGDTPAGRLELGAECRAFGVCGQGTVECAAGDPQALTTTCSSGPGGSESGVEGETCNGADDDCDGTPDNGVEPPAEFGCLGGGLCAGTVPTCAGELGWTCPYGDGYEAEQELTCDGADNDCDGDVDEELAAPADLGCLVAGVCAAGAPFCGGEQGWQCGYPDSHEPEAELTCDGLDNDCDGDVDEDVLAPPALCLGEGVCAGTAPRCGGDEGWRCPYPDTFEADNEQVCDGLDNDCDGTADEDVLPPDDACLTAGVCAAVAISCGGDEGWRCDYPDGYQPGGELDCDGVDNDCDGFTDEDFDPPLAERQLGVCAGATQVCAGEGGWAEPDYSGLPDYEEVEQSCDGLDNDCDGVTDEDVAVPEGHCPSQGVCEQTIARCMGAAGWFCEHPQTYEVQERTCDGLDNDCDGEVDEQLEQPADVCPSRGVCVGAPVRCAAEQGWVCDFPVDVYEADAEQSCDGLDNDCDGFVDEELQGALADVQDGVCEGASKVCSGAAWVEPDYATIPGFEPGAEETCDGLDNDCDGEADEALVGAMADEQRGVCNGARRLCVGGDWVEPDYSVLPGYEDPEESCDGSDNDCDGQVDEDILDPCNGCGLGDECVATCGHGTWDCLDLGAGPEPVCGPGVRLVGQADFVACGLTLARVSAATAVVDGAGTVRRFDPDELRVAWVEGLGEATPFLEPAGENVIRSSENLGVAPWGTWGDPVVSQTTEEGAPTGPDQEASEVFLPAWASVFQAPVLAGDYVGQPFVLSFWARAGSLDRLTAEQLPATVRIGAEVELSNDWQRYVLPFEGLAGGAGDFRLSFRNRGAIDGTVYIWGVQLEEALYASSYIPSAADLPGQRAADALIADRDLVSAAGGTWAAWIRPQFAADEQTTPVELMALDPPPPGIDPYVSFTYRWDTPRAVGLMVCTSGALTAEVQVPADLWEAGDWLLVSCGWRQVAAGQDQLEAALWTPGSLRPSPEQVGDLGFGQPPPQPQLRVGPQVGQVRDIRLYGHMLDHDELREVAASTRGDYGL